MSSKTDVDNDAYTFSAFTLDIGRGALFRDNIEIKLRPQSFEVLRILVTRPGKLVTREELQAAVWGHKVVTEDSLAHCLIDIRKALNDSDRKIIRTVPRRGYILDEPVVERTGSPIEKVPASNVRRRNRFVLASSVLAVTALTALWFFVVDDMRIFWPARSNSIAVLPFLDLSEDKTQEYFADGVAEELLNLLAKVPELRVISRTSASAFKGKDISIPEIAEQLNVAHVLEGSVRRSGNRIRITAQLIEARSDTHVWSETYDRELKDIFAIQDEVSAHVVNELKITLLGDAPKSIVTDPEAYELFLQARFLADQFTVDGMRKAIELYERVLDIDPEYVPAWAWMAKVRGNLWLLGEPDAKEQFRLRGENINQALAIDPDSAIALAIASVVSAYDGDIAQAVSQIRRAHEFSPNNLEVIRNSAFIFEILSRNDDYVAVMAYVLARDPLNAVVRADTTWAYVKNGNYQKAIEMSEQTLAMWPDDFIALIALPWAEYLAGNPEAALRSSERVLVPWYRIQVASVAHHALGNRDAYESGIRAMRQMLEEGVPPSNHYELANLYGFVGDRDAAYSELEKSIELGEPQVKFNDLPYAAMFGEPRYEALMERAGMPREKMEAIHFMVDLPPQ